MKSDLIASSHILAFSLTHSPLSLPLAKIFESHLCLALFFSVLLSELSLAGSIEESCPRSRNSLLLLPYFYLYF